MDLDPAAQETLWGNPVTTREMIEKVVAAGFTAIRIPVTWYPQVDEDLTIDPAWMDRVAGLLAVSLHYYSPYYFALHRGSEAVARWSADGVENSGPGPIEWGLDRAERLFVSQGVPVVLGEMGALNRGNTADRVAWAGFYAQAARERGMPVFWWDNGRLGVTRTDADGSHFGLLDRSSLRWVFPEIVAALLGDEAAPPAG